MRHNYNNIENCQRIIFTILKVYPERKNMTYNVHL